MAVRSATRDEAEAVASIVRRAFATVAEALGVDIPPIHEDGSEVVATLDAGDSVLVAVIDGQLVGTVRGENMDSESVTVRRLAVLPKYRGRGAARALMRQLEAAYPHARRFELFTGAEIGNAVALYESLGYTLMEPRDIDGGVPFVFMEKCR